MDVIWAPWRMEFIESQKDRGCIFCHKSGEKDDEANLIVFRGGLSFVLLNLYPYNPGHLMVSPYAHKAELSDLTEKESLDLFLTLNKSIDVLKSSVNPEGFNIGINLGTVAGAGIAAHLHIHVVPRWEGDTNFMPVLADSKVIPEHLNATWRKLKEEFEKKS